MTAFRRGVRTSQYLPVIALFAAGLPATASAHVSIAPAEARANSYQRLAFQVPHGCGAAATNTLRVQIPEGVIAVKPMPKPGWTLSTTRGDYAKSYVSHGQTVTSGVKEVVWSGGALADDNYDEFVISSFVTADLPAGRPVFFPTVQQCGSSENRWVEIPAAGQSSHDLKSPAPSLSLVSDSVTVAQAKDPAKHEGHDHGDHDHGAAAADTTKVGDLVIATPWTRATPGGAKIGGGYLKITNTGKASDRLVSISAGFAGHVEIHEMSMDGGVMKMRPLASGLEIKPGESVELKPGGYHVMFMDLKQPLKEGDTVKATLTFDKAGPVDVSFAVNAVGAGAPGGGGHMHH
ncbi:DUF1775 domain-containing protein [Bradyrhizobium sp. WD16]|uniref:DUF1775 domain-containing protein n=1 Tax=Bradyrhizobium sp. WD16 TaxID=1521768 RepID=UPI0020A39E8D|nr:DUF1775 domain-containing protein [Bradyrhizobium sp. WD16]UTD29035.1 copper resistance protein CopZ [Bradyrhizobium sp. WD16]